MVSRKTIRRMCDCTALHLRKLCTKGNAKAQCNLGVMFQEGLGVAKDAAEAVRLYRLAAAQGHARAQYGLGFMFEFGRGVGKKRVETIRLYRLAAAQGHAAASEALDRLRA